MYRSGCQFGGQLVKLAVSRRHTPWLRSWLLNRTLGWQPSGKFVALKLQHAAPPVMMLFTTATPTSAYQWTFARNTFWFPTTLILMHASPRSSSGIPVVRLVKARYYINTLLPCSPLSQQAKSCSRANTF